MSGFIYILKSLFFSCFIMGITLHQEVKEVRTLILHNLKNISYDKCFINSNTDVDTYAYP